MKGNLSMVLRKLFLSIFTTIVFCGVEVYAENPRPCNCPDGQYCADNSNNTCLPCPVGYYCTNNTQYACDGNTIAQETGMSLCESCSAGTYANETHIVCTPCDTGAYIHVDGVCIQCPDETPYSNEEHTQCTACNLGAYVVDNGVCVSCQDGFYPNENHTRCSACNSGAYIVNVYGVCVQCTGATPYANEEHTQCTVCDEGEVVNGICERQTGCGAGRYINENNECKRCPHGFYCPGDTKKSECPKGSYSADGAKLCTKCPVGYTTVGTATSAPMTEADEYPCFLAAVKLGTGPNAIELPSCLTHGKINTKVVKNN